MTRMKHYKSAFDGQKAVILCNGPSLNGVDFESLDGVFCFGLNKIDLLFERTSFRPSCVVAVNDLVIKQNAGFYQSTDLPVFLDGFAARRHVDFAPNHIHLCSYEQGFSAQPEIYVSQGGTVTFVALQLAYYMGFSEVALVGCDHYFGDTGTPHKELRGGERDINHFDARYFANQAWHAPDLAMSEASYGLALQAFQQNGRQLLNASTQTRLETLPLCSLDAFLQ